MGKKRASIPQQPTAKSSNELMCPPLKRMSNSDDAIAELKLGNKRYLSGKDTLDGRDRAICHAKRRDMFQYKQEPWAIVLTCADSRVAPEIVFDMGISDLFVIRVAGNIANDCSIASIEYAVANLPASVIVVLGHENCGAVSAALKGGAISYNLNLLLGHLAPVAEQYGDDWASAYSAYLKARPGKAKEAALAKLRTIELRAVNSNSTDVAIQLRQQSEILASNMDVKIVPAVYETDSGKVKFKSKRYWK